MSANGAADGAHYELWPLQFLQDPSEHNHDQARQNTGAVALIVLNSPIPDYEYFNRLYNNASYCLCADGGANRLHDLLSQRYREWDWTDALRAALPDSVHGDLDSLNDTVRQRYKQIGVEISKDPDQYSTDFGKAIKKVKEELPAVQAVLVLGSIGGRVDQGIGLLGEFYREQKFRHPGVRFWLFSESSVSTILQPGTTILHTPLSSGLITRNVGILPIYGAASITTQGLEWDVQDWPTEMGGQMSTSNHIVADTISIGTNRDVLFTVQRAAAR